MEKEVVNCHREFQKYNKETTSGICIGFSEIAGHPKAHPFDVVHLCLFNTEPDPNKCNPHVNLSMTPREAIHLGYELIGAGHSAMETKLLQIEEQLRKNGKSSP